MADTSLIFRLLAKDETGAGLQSAEGKIRGAGEVFKGIMESALAEKGFDFLKDAVTDADQAQKIMNLTAGAIASTGGAANVSAEDVHKLSESLGLASGVLPDVVQGGANMLLTFSNIRNVGPDKIFDQATQAALNMSAAMTNGNTTLDSVTAASKMLGRALNDPVGSLGALSRAGVQFTAAQKEQIKQLVASGNGIKAQGVILDQVKAKYGNAAAAMATPFQKLQAAVGDAKEKIGMQLMPTITRAINAALPVILAMANAFTHFLSFIQAHANVFLPIAGGIGAVVVGIKAANIATAIWKDGILALWKAVDANPWIAIATLVITVVIALATKFKGFRDFLFTVFGDIVKVVATAFKYIYDTVASVIGGILGLASHLPFGLGHPFEVAANAVHGFTDQVNAAINAIDNLNFAASGDSLLSALGQTFSAPAYNPPAYSAGLGAGQAFNSGLGKGLGGGKGSKGGAASTIQQLQDNVNKAIDTYKNGLVQKFAAVGSIISNDVQGPAGSFGLIGNLQDQLAKAKQFAADIATMRKRGLNPAALNELINAGPEQAGAAARDLAQSSNSQLATVNSLESQIQGAANTYANAQVKAEFAKKPDINKNVVNLNLDLSGVSNDSLVKALRQAVRARGGNVQVVLGGAA